MNLHTIIGLISVTTDKRWKGLEEKLRDIAASFKVTTVYVCVYVRMYVCTYVSTYVCIYVCTYVCMYVTYINLILAGNCKSVQPA